MHSLLVDVNHIRNLATKNSFVAHEARRRSWKSLTLLCSGDDLRKDGFTETFKFDSRPPQSASWHQTPSIEDFEHSSSAATVVASRRWRRWRHFTNYCFTAPRLCIRPVCTAQLQRRPCSNIFSNWERVDPLCLQTFLVITDKRGRSIWVW